VPRRAGRDANGRSPRSRGRTAPQAELLTLGAELLADVGANKTTAAMLTAPICARFIQRHTPCFYKGTEGAGLKGRRGESFPPRSPKAELVLKAFHVYFLEYFLNILSPFPRYYMVIHRPSSENCPEKCWNLQ